METNAEIDMRIAERFEVVNILTKQCILGDSRALVISGPPGLGKSYDVEKVLRAWNPQEDCFGIFKGKIEATGLYKLLYKYRRKGQLIVLDDADSIWKDEDALNLLKTCCDTTERRIVSWGNEYTFTDELGKAIPNRFEFHGSVILITNLDFDLLIKKGKANANHFAAMISRAHYVDLEMKCNRDYLIRISQVIRQGLLDHLPLNQREDVVKYIFENADKLRELSLRMAIKIGQNRKAGDNWKKISDVTCCKK